MKTFVMKQIGETAWIDKEKPEAGPRDAILRPIAIAPCTSDIHTVYEGGIGERQNLVLGHEAVGEVIEVGSKVEDFRSGDRVIVPAITPDWYNTDIQDNYHQHSNGMLFGFQFANLKDGVFSEYFHVNDADLNLAHLPDEISPEAAVMLTDMVTTGLHGAELADIEFGDSVAVIGIGPVGLMAIAGAKLRGASRLFGAGSREVCAEVASDFGMTDQINYKEVPISEQIDSLTYGKGVDATIIAGGDSDVLTTAVEITKPGGNISNINYFSIGESLPIPRLAWGNGMAHKTIKGGLCPGGRIRMERLANLVTTGRLNPEKLITHHYNKFEDIEEAFKLMKDKPRDLIKPVVTID
ncbi:NAD(P)-dependent alcohol dehydrogenase [Natranaerofaba carboxydovora]|uniref:NAD(P)-dependent alcohol dehydrogenase n=1 Tax=Natranaerofaba carboxydovora TaxID=2742683 RepID=UPI001F13AF03